MLVSISSILAASVFIYMGSKISFYSRRKFFRGDAAIVLGNSIKDGQPSSVFKERIDHAINLYQRKRIKYIIFTGGLVEEENTTEAEVAKQYASKSGVKKEHILIENRSRVTFENLIFAKEIIKSFQFKKVLIISDPYHMRRAMSMVRDLHMEAYPSPTPSTKYKTVLQRMGFLSREIPATIFYFSGRPVYSIIRKFTGSH